MAHTTLETLTSISRFLITGSAKILPHKLQELWPQKRECSAKDIARASHALPAVEAYFFFFEGYPPEELRIILLSCIFSNWTGSDVRVRRDKYHV